jgi:hypothetical protein
LKEINDSDIPVSQLPHRVSRLEANNSSLRGGGDWRSFYGNSHSRYSEIADSVKNQIKKRRDMDLKSLYKARAIELSASIMPTSDFFSMSVMHDGESCRLMYLWSELCPGKREAYIAGERAEDGAINARGESFFKDVVEGEALPCDEQELCDARAADKVAMKLAEEMQYRKKKSVQSVMPEPPAGPAEGEVWGLDEWNAFNIKMEEYRRIIKSINDQTAR